MTLTVVAFLMCLGGAIPIGWMEVALRPESKHFPCFHPAARACLVYYALVLANRAAVLFGSIWNGEPIPISWDQVLAGTGLLCAHWTLFILMMKVRAPWGAWTRWQDRWVHLREIIGHLKSGPDGHAASLAAQGAPVLQVLKADGAKALPPGASVQDLIDQ